MNVIQMADIRLALDQHGYESWTIAPKPADQGPEYVPGLYDPNSWIIKTTNGLLAAHMERIGHTWWLILPARPPHARAEYPWVDFPQDGMQPAENNHTPEQVIAEAAAWLRKHPAAHHPRHGV